MDSLKISVIITIHNAEKYLQECIESVLKQTFTNFEILCMDGGSTDATPQILKEYAQKDGRIRIINDPNTSYGHKVNRGISEACGEYISVLESDDMYKPYMLEKLYEAIKEHDADFVNGNYIEFYDIGNRRIHRTVRMYSDCDYNRLINYRKQPKGFGDISRYWTGLFKKEFFIRENIRMNESPGASYQDMSFRFLTSVLASAAYHLDIPVYLYRIDNPNSSIYDSKKTVVIAEEHNFLKNELIRRNITEPYVWHIAYEWKYMDFRGNMRHLSGIYRQELFERYLEELEKDRVLLEQYKGNGYSQIVAEMIYKKPEKVAELIETDIRMKNGRQDFWDRIMQLDKNCNIVVFGCGKRGSTVLEEIHFLDTQICCTTDNSRDLWHTQKNNHMVLPPVEAVNTYPDALYIVANRLHAQNIVEQLNGMGIHKDMICLY